MIFIIENEKMSILFKKEKTDPKQKKVKSETTNKISFEHSMLELASMLKCSLKANKISFKEHLNKDSKKANIHVVVKI